MTNYDAFDFLSLTQLGELFEVSSHTMGRWLVTVDLRTTTLKPSAKALSGGFCTTVKLEHGGPFVTWHRIKTIRELEKAGYRQAGHEQDEHEPSKIVGPFTVESNNGDGHQIADANGNVAIWVRGAELAGSLMNLMNLAHKHGKLFQ